MTIPKVITIGGQKVKVKFEPFKDYGGYTFGQYFHDDKLIQLNTDLTDEDIIETLRHEMMEASLLISGVGFSERYEQEAVVRCMEEIFFPAWESAFKKIKI
tara:strand:+ start:839 stop:1141 length:303 start_codon:yes stop_codon:yes gene_type:complete